MKNRLQFYIKFTKGMVSNMNDKYESVKILPGFNNTNLEFWDLNCADRAIMVIYEYWGINSSFMVYNSVFYYNYKVIDERFEPLFVCEELKLNDKEKSSENVGIIKKIRKYGDNVIEDIIDSISNGRPVVIAMKLEDDREFIQNRGITVHNICIYGYDSVNKILYGMDSSTNLNLFKYESILYNFDAVENSMKTSGIDFYLEVYTDKNKSLPYIPDCYYQKIYLSNFYKNKELWINGLSNLKKFTEEFDYYISNQSVFNENFGKLYRACFTLIDNLKMRNFILAHIFPKNKKISDNLELIINNWFMYRSLLEKYHILGNDFNLSTLKKQSDRLKDIYNSEQIINAELLKTEEAIYDFIKV